MWGHFFTSEEGLKGINYLNETQEVILLLEVTTNKQTEFSEGIRLEAACRCTPENECMQRHKT